MTSPGEEPSLDLLRHELNTAAAGGGMLDQHPKSWVLFGSTVLLLYGLRDHIADVDVFVAPDLTDILAAGRDWVVRRPSPHDPPFLERIIAGVRVHVFDDWTARDPEVCALQCRAAAILVHGWWCTPLQIIRMHKAMSIEKHAGERKQAKHFPDIASIDAYTTAHLPRTGVPSRVVCETKRVAPFVVHGQVEAER